MMPVVGLVVTLCSHRKRDSQRDEKDSTVVIASLLRFMLFPFALESGLSAWQFHAGCDDLDWPPRPSSIDPNRRYCEHLVEKSTG